jgi:hypothetical protein
MQSTLVSTMSSGRPPTVDRNAASTYEYKRLCTAILFHIAKETAGNEAHAWPLADGPCKNPQSCGPLNNPM